MDPLPRRKRADDAKSPLRYVIVGGGIAGVSCAQELRRLSADAEVTILTESDTIVAVRLDQLRNRYRLHWYKLIVNC
jgi:pyruvate/2-oxoglutarate dehydrogenase complex dihydrolipoamide dehydrogenase (E3) component